MTKIIKSILVIILSLFCLLLLSEFYLRFIGLGNPLNPILDKLKFICHYKKL